MQISIPPCLWVQSCSTIAPTTTFSRRIGCGSLSSWLSAPLTDYLAMLSGCTVSGVRLCLETYHFSNIQTKRSTMLSITTITIFPSVDDILDDTSTVSTTTTRKDDSGGSSGGGSGVTEVTVSGRSSGSGGTNYFKSETVLIVSREFFKQ